MNGSATASPPPSLQGKRTAISPSAETGGAPWPRGMGSLGPFEQVMTYQPPEEYGRAVTAKDLGLPELIFTNLAGGTGGGLEAYCLVDPSARNCYLRLPSGRGKTKWVDVAEAAAFLLPQADSLTAGGVYHVKPPTEAATGLDPSNARLEAYLVRRLKTTFVEAVDEVFADGMESTFSRKLHAVVRTYGDVAISAINRLMQFERVNAEVAAEALRQIGSTVDPRSLRSRLTLLLYKLESPDPRIRDAASLGIAALDDPAAIGAIRRAIGRERSAVLRRNLQLVLDQLQATQRWRAS